MPTCDQNSGKPRLFSHREHVFYRTHMRAGVTFLNSAVRGSRGWGEIDTGLTVQRDLKRTDKLSKVQKFQDCGKEASTLSGALALMAGFASSLAKARNHNKSQDGCCVSASIVQLLFLRCPGILCNVEAVWRRRGLARSVKWDEKEPGICPGNCPLHNCFFLCMGWCIYTCSYTQPSMLQSVISESVSAPRSLQSEF